MPWANWPPGHVVTATVFTLCNAAHTSHQLLPNPTRVCPLSHFSTSTSTSALLWNRVLLASRFPFKLLVQAQNATVSCTILAQRIISPGWRISLGQFSYCNTFHGGTQALHPILLIDSDNSEQWWMMALKFHFSNVSVWPTIGDYYNNSSLMNSLQQRQLTRSIHNVSKRTSVVLTWIWLNPFFTDYKIHRAEQEISV